MLRTILSLLALVTMSSAVAEPSYINFPSDIDWVTKSSDHFRIVYRRGQSGFADRALRSAERAYGILRPIFPDAPEFTWIVLADFQDSLNGYSLDLPYPHMVLFASPPDPTGQLAALDHWLDSLVLHEYTHSLHLYPVRGLWKVGRTLFGSWVLPIGLMPSHMHEGLATFIETEFSRGGRGRGTVFPMYRRMAVLENHWGHDFAPPDLRDGATSRWPHGTSPYFFGYYLYRELWKRKGPSGIRLLTEDLAGQWPYLFGGSFENVYGQTLEKLWGAIYANNAQEAREEIQRIKSEPLSSLHYLTDSRFNKSDLAVLSGGSQLAFRASDPVGGSRIEVIRTSDGKKIKSYDVDPDSRTGLCGVAEKDREWLMFLETMGGRGYRTSRLTSLDRTSGERHLFKTAHGPVDHILVFGCPPPRAQSVFVYREHRGEGRLEEYDWGPPHRDSIRRAQWVVPQGNWISTIAMVDSHAIFALRSGDTTTLYRWNPPTNPVPLYSTPALVYSLRTTAPGTLTGILNIDGRDEVWEWDLGTNTAHKRVAVIGGVNGFATDGTRQWVTNYRHGGFDVAEVSRVRSSTHTFRAPVAPEPSPSPSVRVGSEKSYSAWPTLLPTAWIPSAFIVPNGFQVGAMVPGFDVAQKNYYSIFGGYDSRGSAFADLSYLHRFAGVWGIDGQAYYFPSYIISSKTFLTRWGASVGIAGNTDFARALGAGTWSVRLSAIFKRLERYRSNPHNQSVGFGLELSRAWNVTRRPMSVSPEWGTVVSITHERYFKALGGTDDYTSTIASLTQYLPAPWWRNHAWYASLRAGYTKGTTLLNNYYQGGGELIFSQGRDFFLNRGFYPGSFLNRQITNFTLEYRFPIAQIDRGWDYFPAFLKRIHGALVWDTTTPGSSDRLNDDEIFKTFGSSVGLELKTDWTVSYYLPAVARVGVYRGFGRYAEPVYATFALEASL